MFSNRDIFGLFLMFACVALLAVAMVASHRDCECNCELECTGCSSESLETAPGVYPWEVER